MKIISAGFVTSVSATGEGIPRDGLPQVALVGRSNVGKSSLINAMTRRTIARTGAAPGKTRLANVYRVELERIELYLVDLPGYGYARGGANSASELRGAAEAYFSGARPSALGAFRRCALLLVDSRHPGLDADVRAARWIDSFGIRLHVVATKIDKLTRSERARNLTTLGDVFGMAPLPVSAASGEGLDALWKTIVRIGRDADRDG